MIYLGTFSKALSPQLRMGYMVLPHELVDAFRRAKRLMDRHAPAMEQRVLASLINGRAYERHVRRTRRQHERRRVALLAAIALHLGELANVQGTAAGLHVVLWLPALPSKYESHLISAREAGVGVYPVSPLYARESGARCTGLVLGYASLSEEAIAHGIRSLSLLLGEFDTSTSGRR